MAPAEELSLQGASAQEVGVGAHATGSPLGLATSEAGIAGWMEQALYEERRQVERLLVQQHEGLLLRLQQWTADTEGSLLPPQIPEVLLPPLQIAEVSLPPLQIPGTIHTSDSTGREAEHQDSVPAQSTGSHEAAATHQAVRLVSSGDCESQMPHIRPSEIASQKVRSLAEVVECAGTRIFAMQPRRFDHLLDTISGIVVCLFALFLAVQVEYTGFELSFALVGVDGFQGSRPAEQVWPYAGAIFSLIEWGVGFFFCLELFLRIAFRIKLWADRLWNTLDALIVAAFIIERLAGAIDISFDPTLLRMARLFRLMRLLKLVRHVQSLDTLNLIVMAISASMSVLVWTLVLLALSMMIVAVVCAKLLESFIMDPSQDPEARKEVYERWGTFLRAWVSIFEVTLANWGPPCWMLMNNVNVLWGVFFITWRCVVGFAVIQVITSVFIQYTFKAAGREEDIMIQEKQKASEAQMKHLDRLFTKLDKSGDGLICREEFEAALKEPRVKHWFAALEINVKDVPELFLLLDDGAGQISKEDFLTGLKKITGPAHSIDLYHVMKDCQRIRRALGDTVVETSRLKQKRGALPDLLNNEGGCQDIIPGVPRKDGGFLPGVPRGVQPNVARVADSKAGTVAFADVRFAS